MVPLSVGSPLSISVQYECHCRGLARDVTQQRRNQKVVRHGLYAANSCRASSQSSFDKCHAMKLLYTATLLLVALLSGNQAPARPEDTFLLSNAIPLEDLVLKSYKTRSTVQSSFKVAFVK